jgi:hypothetical protein
MAVRQPFPQQAADAPSCSIWYIQLRLGRHDYSVPRMLTYVSQLTEQYQFPRAYPRMKAGKLVCDISDKSRWPREAVDQWLADFLPPDTVAALDAVAMAAAAAQMDGRAANLRLVKGGR